MTCSIVKSIHQSKCLPCYRYEGMNVNRGGSRVCRFSLRGCIIDLKTDNLERVSIPTKIVATFDVEHPIHGTTYGPK